MALTPAERIALLTKRAAERLVEIDDVTGEAFERAVIAHKLDQLDKAPAHALPELKMSDAVNEDLVDAAGDLEIKTLMGKYLKKFTSSIRTTGTEPKSTNSKDSLNKSCDEIAGDLEIKTLMEKNLKKFTNSVNAFRDEIAVRMVENFDSMVKEIYDRIKALEEKPTFDSRSFEAKVGKDVGDILRRLDEVDEINSRVNEAQVQYERQFVDQQESIAEIYRILGNIKMPDANESAVNEIVDAMTRIQPRTSMPNGVKVKYLAKAIERLESDHFSTCNMFDFDRKNIIAALRHAYGPIRSEEKNGEENVSA